MAVVLTGQRCVGKSCILKQFKNEKEADAGNKNFLVMFCFAYSLKYHSRFDVHHFFNNWLEVNDGIHDGSKNILSKCTQIGMICVHLCYY